MRLTDVKKELKNLNKDQLIDLITDLYKKNKSVKDYLDFYVNPDEKELLEKYRNKVFEAFYPKRGYHYKLKDGKQAISDFKKHEPSAESIADLMLFYVETGVKFTNEFGDIGESFYSSIETTYNAVLKLMKKENLLHKFAKRAGKIVSDTRAIGWGFHDFLFYAHSNFYTEPSEGKTNRQ